MRLIGFLSSLILGAVLLMGGAQAADPPLAAQPNPDVFQYNGQDLSRYNTAQTNLMQTGVWRWSHVQVNGCPSLLPYVVEALDDISRTFGIFMQYDEANGHKIYSNCAVSLDAICGQGAYAGGINCLNRGYPYNVDIDLNAGMVNYQRESILAVIRHEYLHASATWNEQYCYTARCAGTITCIGGWRDVMNCGPDSRHGFEYVELQRWARTMGPRQAAVYGTGTNAGGLYVYVCGVDPKATRLALLAYRLADGRYRWLGATVPMQLDRNGCMGYGAGAGELNLAASLEAGELVCVNMETAVSVFWGRNDTCVPR